MGNWNSSMIFASAGLMLKHVWEAAGFIPLASRGDVEVWVWKKVSTSALEHWKDQNKRELRREVILRTFLHFHLQGPSYTEYKHLWLCETCWFILCSLVSTTGEEKKKKNVGWVPTLCSGQSPVPVFPFSALCLRIESCYRKECNTAGESDILWTWVKGDGGRE